MRSNDSPNAAVLLLPLDVGDGGLPSTLGLSRVFGDDGADHWVTADATVAAGATSTLSSTMLSSFLPMSF